MSWVAMYVVVATASQLTGRPRAGRFDNASNMVALAALSWHTYPPLRLCRHRMCTTSLHGRFSSCSVLSYGEDHDRQRPFDALAWVVQAQKVVPGQPEAGLDSGGNASRQHPGTPDSLRLRSSAFQTQPGALHNLRCLTQLRSYCRMAVGQRLTYRKLRRTVLGFLLTDTLHAPPAQPVTTCSRLSVKVPSLHPLPRLPRARTEP